jgi:murein DD-endopeptidase MepM/ murein hydrolase activator NlpD
MRQRSSVAVAFAIGAAVAVLVMGFAWRPLQRIWIKLRPETPHQRYARLLVEGGLARTALGTEWLAAATGALRHPVTLTVPFTEEALLDPARPVSIGYAVTLKRGQKLDVQVTLATDTPSQVFVDLFKPTSRDSEMPRPITTAEAGESVLTHESDESGIYLLRVQPELLRGGHMRITSTATPSLRFPVSGAGMPNLQSFYGDARDAGRRSHEGVDIFAPRGTPVLSASNGLVMNVGQNTLGGNVVWVWDVSRGMRFYYAHLQDQRVRTGGFVNAGDTLGTVGNTGNARTTPPHLHFGIYARGEGAIDPDAFIRPTPSADNPRMKTSALGEWARTRGALALRASPSAAAPILEMLPRASTIRIEGAVGSWVRTSTGRHSIGFVDARQLDVATN